MNADDADRLFIAVAFRQRSEVVSNVLGFSPIDAEVGLKPEALLSAQVRCLKTTAMKKSPSPKPTDFQFSRTVDTVVSHPVTIVT